MKHRYSIYIIFILSLIPVGFQACSKTQPISPASFRVLTLNVSPQQLQVGQEVNITAEVANTGGLPGNFDQPLLVNGKQADISTVTIQPGYSKSVAYKFTPAQPGEYTVQLGERRVSFKATGLMEKEVELKYDNGQPRDALWAGNNGGFLVCFDPSYRPFNLKMVRICGGVYGTAWEGKSFDLMLLDSDMKSIIRDETYAVARFPVRSAFPYQDPVWVDFTIPSVTFNDKFYVYLYTSMGKHHGIHVGVDDSSVNNQTSFLAQGRPPAVAIVEPWTQYPLTIWYSDITKINWMIRARGTALVPE